jgi:hypothetical protein
MPDWARAVPQYARNSPNTLEILQELGFLYHIDDVSRDEPFINVLPKGSLVTVRQRQRLSKCVPRKIFPALLRTGAEGPVRPALR